MTFKTQLMDINMNDVKQVVKQTRKEAGFARRQALLDAACHLIFARGYEPVSLSEIGAVAGVSGPAIYRHFGCKADILHTLCHQTIDRLIEFVGPRLDDPRRELAALVDGHVRLVVRYPEMVRVFEDEERSLPLDLRRSVRNRERDHARRWTSALRRLQPEAPGEAHEVKVFAAVGMILSMPRWPVALRSTPDLEVLLRDAAWRILEHRSEDFG
jgi:AcrR family transcriptional regulator